MKRTFHSYNLRNLGPDAKETDSLLSMPQLVVSGATAGIANSFVAGPVENVRIRLQTQKPGTQLPGYTYYNGPLDAFRKIYGQFGMKGVFKGQIPTIYREIVGYGAYFGTYEFLVQQRMRFLGTTNRDVITGQWSMLFGAISGFAFWLACYPLDVVKSKVQVDSMDSRYARYKGIADALGKTYQAEGFKGFTRGLGWV